MEQNQCHSNHNDFIRICQENDSTNHHSSNQYIDYPSTNEKSESTEPNHHANNGSFLNLGSLISPPSTYNCINFNTSAKEDKPTFSTHLFQRSFSYSEPVDTQSRSSSSSTSSLFDGSCLLNSYSLAPPMTYATNGSAETPISPMSTTAEDLTYSLSSSPLVDDTTCHSLQHAPLFNSIPSTIHYHKASVDSKSQIHKKSKRSRKGCLTCRSRKKKCCETKPLCTECRRLGINCRWAKPGYERKNKSKNNDYSPDLYYDPEFGKIKTLRGVVEKKIVG
ncbi:unnamed protein product [Ambrosiozyma monospora]|uniref:Unnamed protein product n=1 Tax=Ambrosiozyma monospora TaxID=43982 RepID=A0ACB5T7P3_AMBMO|nr:unnamed protein product [Ambrosiozyma monospora]